MESQTQHRLYGLPNALPHHHHHHYHPCQNTHTHTHTATAARASLEVPPVAKPAAWHFKELFFCFLAPYLVLILWFFFHRFFLICSFCFNSPRKRKPNACFVESSKGLLPFFYLPWHTCWAFESLQFAHFMIAGAEALIQSSLNKVIRRTDMINRHRGTYNQILIFFTKHS